MNNGKIQGITDTRGNAFSASYSYDALGRLAQGQTLDLTSANTWKLGWVYDRYGNRSQQNLLGGTISVTQPQLTIAPTTNRITTSGYQYDTAGNLQADALGNTYTYDAENRATAISGGNPATYAYDGNGLRVKRAVGSTTTNYIFSGSKVIAEYANGTLSARYVYAGSQLLATIASGVATYHYPDHLSSRMETNASGGVTRTFGHLPFGETWYETGTTIKWKFTSYERDSESGLDYAMFRYDSSRLGRFMTADLLSGSAIDPQSLNRFAYVGNDPVNFVDPLGLQGKVCPFIAPDQIDMCGGGKGGDGGDGGAFGGWGGLIYIPVYGYWWMDGWHVYIMGYVEVLPPGGGGQGSNGRAANNSIKQKICSAIPSGRTVGVSGGVGGVGSVVGGGELVINYDSGQVSAFGFGGAQVGWNGGLSASVYGGFVWGLNSSNSNYSGGFTGVNGGAGLGGFAASSSGGLTGGPGGLIPNPRSVTAGGVSLGTGLLPGFTGGVNATNYTNPLQLGKYWASSPLDGLFIAARSLCK